MSLEIDQANHIYAHYIHDLRSGAQIEPDPTLLKSPSFILKHAITDILCSNHADQIANFETLLHLALNDTEPIIRARAIVAVRLNFDKLPKEKAQDLIVDHLADECWEVRKESTSALGAHFSEIPDSNTLLLNQSKDPNPQVRITALEATDKNYPEVDNVENLLKTLSNDPDPRVRSKVLSVIHNQRKTFEDLLSWIIPFTTDQSEEVRQVAGNVLWSASHTILPPDQIARMFIDDSPPEIRNCMVLLVRSRFNEINKPQEIVLKGLRDPDPEVKQTALQVLIKHTWKLLPHCSADLLQLCEDENEEVRNSALWIKSEITKHIDRKKDPKQ